MGMANSEQNTKDGLGQGGEGGGRQRNTDWATVHSCAGCALHKGLPISEIRDLCLNDTFPADSGNASCCPHMGGSQYFPHRQSVLGEGCLFQIGTEALMNPWWPCTETKEEKALSLSPVHAPTHTDTQPSRDQEMDERKTRNRTGAGRGRWGHRTASPGKEGCTGGGGGKRMWGGGSMTQEEVRYTEEEERFSATEGPRWDGRME